MRFNSCKSFARRESKTVVKHTDSILEKKGGGRILILVYLYVGSYKLLGFGRTIYMWELYVVIKNIQRNKEQSSYLLCLCVLLSSTILIIRDEERKISTAINMFYNSVRHIVRAASRRDTAPMNGACMSSLWSCAHASLSRLTAVSLASSASTK